MAWGMKNVRICLFGSSIMEGRIGVDDPAERWYNLLYIKLSRRFPEVCFNIVNSAVGGESTREIMARFQKDVVEVRPDYCFFMVGANNHDCCHPERCLTSGELETLMRQFSIGIPDFCSVVGFVMNPVINECHSVTRAPEWKDYLAKFGGLDEELELERVKARDFFAAQGWPVVDLGILMRGRVRDFVLAEDGIHLSPAGHEFMAEKVFEVMEKELSGGC